VVLPFVIGWVARRGYHRQLYESAVSAGLITVANIVIFTALIWAAALMLRKQEASNRRAEEAGRAALLKEQEARAEALAEQQARSRAEAAERQAAASAAENARLYQEAQQAVRTREEVLAVVSHDLKTPLGTIALSASLLRRLRVPAELEPKLHKHADTIARSVGRMNALIGDLLDMASLRAGQLVLDERRWPVAELVGDVLGQFEPQAMHKRLELGAGLQAVGSAWVRCDRRRVFQVLANLVGNAIKFTPELGSVRLEVEPAGDRLRFLVRDTGPGIAPEHLPHLFDPFWQAKETARLGTGLGLPIARALVAAHGGELTVESRPGEGSTFAFTLPRAEPEEARSAPEPHPAPDTPKTH
jgi:signal transduction histidine kinase